MGKRVAAACVWSLALLASRPTASRSIGTDGRIDAHGVSIHYVVAGRGAPVILVHGLYGSARLTWITPGIFAELSKTREVIAIDLPGHGDSDAPADARVYGARLADDVVLLMDDLHLSDADIVGYGAGGMIVAKLLATRQARLRSAVIAGMGWVREGAPPDRWERAPGLGVGRTPPVVTATLAELVVSAAELKAIRVPTLVVVGDHDPVTVAYVAPLRQVRSDWPVVMIAGAGHLDCVTRPEFRQTLVDWLSRH